VREKPSHRRARGAPPVALRETCRVVGGRVPMWPYHHARLRAGGCADGVLDQAERAVYDAAAEWAEGDSPRVRLSLTVGEDGSVAVDVRRRLSSLDVPGGPIPVRVDVPERPTLPPGCAKPADRAWWDGVQKSARLEGGHQAVIVGPDDLIIDGGTSTLWIGEGSRLVTPPSPPAIAGVARALLCKRAPAIHLRIDVEPISWERFEAADEAFCTNAFAGAVAFRKRGGYLGNAASEMFEELWRSAL
jgi:branched-subunit amino acid aminotransferase/4-amino-4-deoxychorismate lyase